MRRNVISIVVVGTLCAVLNVTKVQAAEEKSSYAIPPDTPEHFMDRYRYLLRKDERKTFEEVYKRLRELDKKIRKLDERIEQGRIPSENVVAERQALITERAATLTELPPLIEAFWKPRDPLPATPGNEYKDVIDQRIQDIAQERFFTSAETPGLSFRANGGYYGDMAQVYLLHGTPSAISMVEGRLFVPLMLWLYADPSDGGVLYAFMFYERISGPPYQLFEQDAYQMNPCAAINEISSRQTMIGMQIYQCTDQTQLVYRELIQSMPTGNISGYTFAWALFNFSRDPSVRLGQALAPPEPVADIARRSTSRVRGGVPDLVVKEGIEVIRANCASCGSMIPADLVFVEREHVLSIKRTDVDWFASDEELSSEMAFVVIMENGVETIPIVHRQTVWVRSSRTLLTDRPDEILNIPLFKSEEFAAVPSGSYRVTVYIRSTLTNRYNAWRLSYVKQ